MLIGGGWTVADLHGKYVGWLGRRSQCSGRKNERKVGRQVGKRDARQDGGKGREEGRRENAREGSEEETRTKPRKTKREREGARERETLSNIATVVSSPLSCNHACLLPFNQNNDKLSCACFFLKIVV